MRARRLFQAHSVYLCVLVLVRVFVQECMCLHCIMDLLSIITDNYRQICRHTVLFNQTDSEAVDTVARFSLFVIGKLVQAEVYLF